MINVPVIGIVGAVSAVIGAAVPTAVFALPYIKKYKTEAKEAASTNQAMREVLLGRPAEPDNPITGESGRPELLGIGERLNGLSDLAGHLQQSQVIQIGKLNDVIKEVRTSNEQRIVKIEDTVEDLRTQVNGLHRQVEKLIPIPVIVDRREGDEKR